MKTLIVLAALFMSLTTIAQVCREVVDPFTNKKSITTGMDSLETDGKKLYFKIERHSKKIFVTVIDYNIIVKEGYGIRFLFTDGTKAVLPARISGDNLAGMCMTYSTIKGDQIWEESKHYDKIVSHDIKMIRLNETDDYILKDQRKFSAALKCVIETY